MTAIAAPRATMAAMAHALPRRAADQRLRALFRDHAAFVWRSLRRLGVPERDVADAAQRVWLVIDRNLERVSEGAERSYAFGTAMRVASEYRRADRRRREDLAATVREESVPESQRPDGLLRKREARTMLDKLLAVLDDDARAVFVLYELEELTTGEIARMLDVPTGTVASRLRRAREDVQREARRQRAIDGTRGDGR